MKNKENYLEKIPFRNTDIKWNIENDLVTLELENKGILKLITQKLLKKPKISYIHLDEFGSFVWNLIDGKADIIAIGVLVNEHFGEKAQPLYPRLSQYLKTLESYNFIKF